MKQSLILLVLLLSISLSAQKGMKTNAEKLSGIDKKMEEILKITKSAGFAVAVVDKDKVIYAKGFGYRDYENKIKADENTLFAIGSSSKAFTAAQMGVLAEQGKLKLEDSPAKYLPKLKFNNDELNAKVQIKDFMCHRSGLPRHDFSWYFFPTIDRDILLARMEHQEPFAQLREFWYYNNFGFLIQGRIGEVLTEKSWEENMDELFFTPLGMNRTNCSIEALEKDDNHAIGYTVNKDEEIESTDYYKISGMAPAGAINSSVSEMAKWVSCWINGGKYEDKTIFPAPYAEDAISSHAVVGKGVPGKDNPDLHMSTYGYGWFLSSYRGHYRVEHGGNIDGFSANVCFFPSDSLGIIVLANQGGSSVPYLVRNTISDQLFNIKDPSWISEFKEAQEKQKKAKEEVEEVKTSNKIAGTSPSHKLSDYSGTYNHPGYGDIRVFVKEDSLFAMTSLEDTIYLDHHHYDLFMPFAYEDGKYDSLASFEMLLNFQTNVSGEISAVKAPFEVALDPIEFKKQIDEVAVSEETLGEYVGEYELSGMTAKFYTKDSDILYLFVQGQPEYELASLGDDIFALKIVEGFKVEFLRDDSGVVKAVNFIQPNGTFKATKK
jgi:CubicO group peptidase (beta-lactamase class C family)